MSRTYVRPAKPPAEEPANAPGLAEIRDARLFQMLAGLGGCAYGILYAVRTQEWIDKEAYISGAAVSIGVVLGCLSAALMKFRAAYYKGRRPQTLFRNTILTGCVVLLGVGLIISQYVTSVSSQAALFSLTVALCLVVPLVANVLRKRARARTLIAITLGALLTALLFLPLAGLLEMLLRKDFSSLQWSEPQPTYYWPNILPDSIRQPLVELVIRYDPKLELVLYAGGAATVDQLKFAAVSKNNATLSPAAWETLIKWYPAAALEIARKITPSQSRLPATVHDRLAGKAIGRNAANSEVMQFLTGEYSDQLKLGIMEELIAINRNGFAAQVAELFSNKQYHVYWELMRLDEKFINAFIAQHVRQPNNVSTSVYHLAITWPPRLTDETLDLLLWSDDEKIRRIALRYLYHHAMPAYLNNKKRLERVIKAAEGTLIGSTDSDRSHAAGALCYLIVGAPLKSPIYEETRFERKEEAEVEDICAKARVKFEQMKE